MRDGQSVTSNSSKNYEEQLNGGVSPSKGDRLFINSPFVLFHNMKDSFYFPHDYHARHDIKLERLRMEIGPAGDGIYWSLVEMLYENQGKLLLADIPSIAKSLNTTSELVEKVVKQSNLFIVKDDFFYSKSLLVRLKHINTKRRKARASANKRWDANAMLTQSESNARKESKVKESKEYNNIYCRVIDYLNKKAKRNYKATTEQTRRLIRARLKDEFKEEEFYAVIDRKCADWLGNEKMDEYLRPATLFGTKFESYLNAPVKDKGIKKWKAP